MLFPKSQVRPLTLPLLYPQTQLRCTSKFSLFWFQTGTVTLFMMTTSLRPDCPLQPTAPQSWWQRTGRNLLIFPVCHLLPESSLGQPTLHALWAFTQHINSLMKAPCLPFRPSCPPFLSAQTPNKQPRQAAPRCGPVGSKGRLENCHGERMLKPQLLLYREPCSGHLSSPRTTAPPTVSSPSHPPVSLSTGAPKRGLSTPS